MSQHQKRQGYSPSLSSTFNSSLTLADRPNTVPGFPPPPHSAGVYPMAQPSPHVHRTGPGPYPSYPGPSRPAPAPPETRTAAPSFSSTSARNNESPPDSSAPSSRLRTVYLPRDCLPRFLTLAKANTNVNIETCGLLLGKPKGEKKYIVTTLLIPKQHSTSDTCTMDEEELVLDFTEARGLITLGWIHTHPSQSCTLFLLSFSSFFCPLILLLCRQASCRHWTYTPIPVFSACFRSHLLSSAHHGRIPSAFFN